MSVKELPSRYLHVCVYVCMYACMYACVYVCMYARMCVYIYIVFICSVCDRNRIAASVPAYACICMWLCMCVCMYVCVGVGVCVYIYIYIYIYIYTYSVCDRNKTAREYTCVFICNAYLCVRMHHVCAFVYV